MNDKDRDEFREIYYRNSDSVYKIAFLHLRNKSDAEDAVQSVFLKYCMLKPEFQNNEHEKAWFIVTARNHCRDILRSWWNRERTEGFPELTCEFLSDNPYGDILEAVMKLKDKYRDLIYLFYYEGYSTVEIAKMLEKNESTVRTQMNRAREQLKKIIRQEENSNAGRKIFQSN